jgi:hypothetical protein
MNKYPKSNKLLETYLYHNIKITLINPSCDPLTNQRLSGLTAKQFICI